MKRGTGNPWRRLGLPARVGWLVVGGIRHRGGAGRSLVGVGAAGRLRDSAAGDELVSVPCLVFAADVPLGGSLRGRAPQIRMAGAG